MLMKKNAALWILLPLLAASPACRGNKSLPQTTPSLLPPSQPLIPSVAELPRPQIREVRSTEREKVIYLDQKTGRQGSSELLAASRAAKNEGSRSARPQAVLEINDDNLAAFSSGANLMVIEGSGGEAETQPNAAAMPNVTSPTLGVVEGDGEIWRDEAKWKSQAAEYKDALQQLVDQQKQLRLDIASLRELFYSETDSVIQESRIRPEWLAAEESAAQNLQLLRDKLAELDEFLEQSEARDVPADWLQTARQLPPTAEELAPFLE
jgi:hypothetical protein